jgi:PTH1 family peptidyl-tRNA hydrolase
MKVAIVGLGNPGDKFKNTPHNVGFEALDNFREKNNFPDFEMQKMFEAEISKGEVFGKEVVLAKPQTFMNNSGSSAKSLIKNLVKSDLTKFASTSLVLVHDDIDLPFGTIKLSKNRGSAGHKGVESIINHLGTEDFVRLRIGIGREKPDKSPTGHCDGPVTISPKASLVGYVLKKFSKKDLEVLKSVLEKSVNALNLLIEQGLEKAMNECNK